MLFSGARKFLAKRFLFFKNNIACLRIGVES